MPNKQRKRLNYVADTKSTVSKEAQRKVSLQWGKGSHRISELGEGNPQKT